MNLGIHPIMPWWAIVLIFVPSVSACAVLLGVRKGSRLDWLRRLLMVLALAVVALRPVTGDEALSTQRLNANVIFVVDLTGSMSAEDFDGSKPRLDGAKADMRRIMDGMEGARFSIITFDSSASAQLPLTTDAGAVKAWIDTARTELTAYSRGSNVDRPRGALQKLVDQTRKDDPHSRLLVYFLSDGENTDNKESEPFGALGGKLDGGAVLGYGTPKGGPMKAVGGENDGEYIKDPSGGRGLSKIDEKNLKFIAQQMGVSYLHRTGGKDGLEETWKNLNLTLIDTTEEQAVPSFEDWYWIASIVFTLLAIWELAELTLRLPKTLSRADVARAGRR